MNCPFSCISIFLDAFSTDLFFHQAYILMYNRSQNQISDVPNRQWITESVPAAAGELGREGFCIITAIYCADFSKNNNRNFHLCSVIRF